MPRNQFNHEAAAQVLIEYETLGLEAVCKKRKITRQTIHNYQKRLKNDALFLQVFERHRQVKSTAHWGEKLDQTMCELIETQNEAILSLRKRIKSTGIDCDDWEQLNKATLVLAEIALSREVLRGGSDEDDQKNGGFEA